MEDGEKGIYELRTIVILMVIRMTIMVGWPSTFTDIKTPQEPNNEGFSQTNGALIKKHWAKNVDSPWKNRQAS